MSRKGHVPKRLCPETVMSRSGYVPKRLCPETVMSRNGYGPKWLCPETTMSRSGNVPKRLCPEVTDIPIIAHAHGGGAFFFFEICKLFQNITFGGFSTAIRLNALDLCMLSPELTVTTHSISKFWLVRVTCVTVVCDCVPVAVGN